MTLTKIAANKIQFPLEGGFYQVPTALTDGATVTPDLDTNNLFTWTIEQNATLGFPSTVPGAGVWSINLTQDLVGNRTLSLASGYNLIDGTVEPSAEAETQIIIVSDGSGADLDVWYYEKTATATIQYSIPNSLRFNDNDSAYLSDTSGSGNRKVWTWSSWVKRANLGTNQMLFGGGTSSTVYTHLMINSSNALVLVSADGGAAVVNKISNYLLRDTSAWYHIMVSVDTNFANTEEMFKLYINGIRLTSWSTNTLPSTGYSTNINNSGTHAIGRDSNQAQYYLDGYLTETHFVDGLALSPDNFGKFTDQGVWIPKVSRTSEWPTNSVLVSGGTGTTIGDMTDAGGNAAAFNGSTEAAASAAQKTGSPSSAYVGKNYGSGTEKIISKFSVKSPTDSDFGGNDPVRVRFQASTTGAWGGEEVTLHDNAAVINASSAEVYTAENVNTTTAYQYYRVLLSDASATTYYISELELWEYTPYGQNGFYLDFEDNSTAGALGTDQSGRGNDYAVSAIATTDQMLDSPSNNIAVASPIAEGNNLSNIATYTDGNLTVTQPGTNGCLVYGSVGVSSGKWVWEITVDNKAATSGDAFDIGIASKLDNSGINVSPTAWNSTYANGYSYEHNGNKIVLGTESSYGSSFTTADVIRVELNLTDNQVTFYKNGTTQGAISITAGLTWHPCWYAQTINDKVTFNFGSSSFVGTPSSRYLELSMANTVAGSITKPSDYFDTVTYTGNAVDFRRLWSQEFKPDLVWIKNRDTNTTDHKLFDSARGATLHLSTNDQNAEAEEANSLKGFDYQGFTLGTGASTDVNSDGIGYVAWSWKKSATSGFDIATYTGTGSSGLTFSHSLGAVPEFMIVKNRDTGTTNWAVYHQFANGGTNPEQYFGLLNSTNAFTNTSGTGYWNDTAPSSSVVTVGNSNDTNASSDAFVAYLWKGISGFSKFGNYTGNGSANGPFVFLNFRPKFIMFKNATTGGAGYNWVIHDSVRDINNPQGVFLAANANSDESTLGTGAEVDFLSNGFKVRTTTAAVNASSANILYAAFAEDPFNTSKAR